MGYTGSLGGVDMAAALQVLGPAKRSGIMSVTSEQGAAIVVLQDGAVIFASSDRSRPFGAALVEKGLLSEADLEVVLKIQRTSERRQLLGELVAGLALVPREVVAAELEEHVTSVLADVMGWPSPELHFDEADGEAMDVVPPFGGEIGNLLLRVLQKSR